MQASAVRKIGHFPEPRTPCHHSALHGYMPAPIFRGLNGKKIGYVFKIWLLISKRLIIWKQNL
jgi:hypothetical protein